MQTTLTVLHAGSIGAVLTQVARDLEQANPDCHVKLIGGGSVDLARRLLAGEAADLFLSADCAVINELPSSLVLPVTPFARNRIVLAWRPGAPAGSEVTHDNWRTILRRPDVRFGHSDPDGDPGGYRTLLVWKLAELHYREPGLFETLMCAPGRRVYGGERMMSFYEEFAMGNFDFAFSYASSATQRGLKSLQLPSEIDLSDPGKSDLYSSVSVAVSGTGGRTERAGAPILYGLTLPRMAPNPELARQFAALLTGPRGAGHLTKAGLLPIN